MHEIDNEKFGTFIVALRKQNGMTQKDLASKLFISDKAVSKWERGLSMPDIGLLCPLANLFNVTVTELLSGQHITTPENLKIKEVEDLVTGTIMLSEKEEQKRKRRVLVYCFSMVIVFIEIVLLYKLGYSFTALVDNVLVVVGLNIFFGGWFYLVEKEVLPSYYDENKISTYSNGIFRMNIPGVYFNNRNWPHILRAGRVWMIATSILFPVVYLFLSWFFPKAWEALKLFFIMFAGLGFFIPMMIVGRKYQ